MKKIFYSLFLLSAVSFKANAQWKKLDIPHDNLSFISTLEVPNENTVWGSISNLVTSAVPTNRYVKTGNAGASWQKKTLTAPSGYVIANLAPIDADTCYASMYDGNDGNGGGIFKTTDGGTSWTQLAVGQLFDDFISFPDFVYFWGAKDGVALGDANTDAAGVDLYMEIYTTHDYGQTWNRVPIGNMPATTQTDRPVGIVNNYAVFGNKIWAQVFDGNPDAGAPEYVWRSDDMGETWQAFPVDATIGRFTDMSFVDDLNGFAVGIQGDGLGTPFLQRTADGGATWSVVNYTGPMMGANICNVPGTGLLMTVNGIYIGPQGTSYSADLGNTWTIIDTGSTQQHTEVKFLDAFVGWSGQYRQLSSTAGGMFQWTGTLLPVNISSFTAKSTGKSVMLNWQTAQETNNAYFAIERSTTGTSFTEIGRVTGKGNSTKPQQYSYEDLSFANGMNYYRLKMVSTDNKATYSAVQKLDLSILKQLKAYPNPASSILKLENLNPSVPNIISIINNAGNIVKTVTVNGGEYTLDVKQLPSGTYFIKVEADKKITTQQFVKE